ncbi:MAG: SRPBCC family protein [Bacteroidota bacterium]
MRKIKKVLWASAPIAVIVILLMSIDQPIAIETTQRLLASREEVFEALASHQRFPNWSPFLVADPNQKHWTTGRDGTVGSKFHWQGVGEESAGFQELVKFERPETLVMHCTITVPSESHPVFRYDLSSDANATLVKQTFVMPSSLFDNILLRALGVVQEISKTNELGLARLKQYVETHKETL